TALNRIKGNDREDTFEILRTEPRGSDKFQEALDESMQPVSAKLAIHQGGLIGKGPGRSTQRYVTPIMFEDYMFSFIVEEYGLLGGIFVIILYVSLMARGSIIVKNCDNQFAKTCVAGLVFLISVQAMLHIMVNCDLGPHTGQTLPMISHGNSSFLMFSIAFGIILSISRMAKRKIDKESAKAAPLVEHDNVRDSVSECESLDNDIQEEADELSNFDDIQN
ncbi:MAG: FtsW/RodA/SpoVE family cell cycle protein, partial [Bacteroidales bacterium]|nr:FtsW/RodA/SpoVE family cell cycle protein [Bacteroidales bacterium]